MTSIRATHFTYWKHWIALIALTLLVTLPGIAGLPVIDRDEARFAQASVQMAESGDLINIRFQDEARNKKPAGIYWLQTGAIKALGKTGERDIWVQRLPSVLGALLAVLMTYWGAARMIGRRGACLAAAMLSLSALMIFEAHIAKTDAVLCGLAACCFSALAHMRNGGGRRASWIFWIGLGTSIMIKGPVAPIIVLLTILTLAIWERKNSWMRQFINWPAILVFFLLWIPWAITIWIVTDGAFFIESLGKDFGGKLVSTQEKHAGPPGYYLGTIWITFWPSCLLLIPGFAFAVRAVRKVSSADTPVAKAMRLCLAWVIPYWILIEIIPTKLPHYVLPLFPALCVMTSAAAITLLTTDEFRVSRRINAGLYLIVSTALIAIVMAASGYYGEANSTYYIIGIIAGMCAIIATFALWRRNMQFGLTGAGLSALILSIPTYHYILPGLTQLRTSDALVTAFTEAGILLPRNGGPEVISPDFTEPSLVYHFGETIDVSGTSDLLDMEALRAGRVILLDQLKKKAEPKLALLKIQAQTQGVCIGTSDPIRTLNYSKGNSIEIIIVQATDCNKIDTFTSEKLDE